MTIPFLEFFKQLTERLRESVQSVTTTVAPGPGVPAEKPSSERLSKTVLPSKLRPGAASPSAYQGAGAAAPNTKLPEAGPRAGGKHVIPPAVALALQPKVERAISLHLSDLLEQMPGGFLKSADTFDTSRLILLKASEIERGMSTGNPTVSLATIYEQVPEIFMHSLPHDDVTHVPLPYEKVLEQFQNVHVREDQEIDADVPQVETPFLQVTIEDTHRFGTPVQALQTSAEPPVKVEPATAKTISRAVPETVAREGSGAMPAKPRGIPLSMSTAPATAPVSPASAPAPAQPAPAGAPTRIPFSLPPNGAGASASERVPASGGPPAPTPPPAKTSAPAPAPARIPFKLSSASPGDALKPKLTLVPGVQPEEPAAVEDVPPPPAKTSAPAPVATAPPAAAPAPMRVAMTPPVSATAPAPAPISPAPSTPAAPSVPAKATAPAPAAVSHPVPAPAAAAKASEPKHDGSSISLSVRAVLLNLPVFQVQGDAESIPAEARLELPLALVESQLAAGKVAVPSKTFQAALPEPHRGFFVMDAIETPVLLPLQEVLKNLPANALQMRPDQEKPEALSTIETPFSLKAKEDAKKVLVPGTVKTPAEIEAEKKAAEAAGKAKPAEITKAAEAKAAEAKPVETKPAVEAKAPEVKAAEAKPAEAKPTAEVKPAETKAPSEMKPAAEIKPTVPAKPSIDLKPLALSKPVEAAKTIETPKLAETPKPVETKSLAETKPSEPAVEKPTRENVLSRPLLESLKPESKPAAETKPVSSVKVEPPVAPKPESKPALTATPKPVTPGLTSLKKPDEKNPAKQTVEKASALAGVAGCSVSFADGLSLAGNMPNDVALDGLCSVAPTLLQKIDRHMLDAKLGSLTSMTLHSAKSPVTFFMKGNVCLTVLHADGELAMETQEKLGEMAKELSRTYSEPETAHVDH